MSSSFAYEPHPLFVDSVEQAVSATALNTVLRNVGVIDAESFRGQSTFDSSAGLDTGTPNYYPAANAKIWEGWLLIRNGMTTLTAEGRAANAGSTQLRMYVNGVQRATATPATPWSMSVPISNLGVSDGQTIAIEIIAVGAVPANATFVTTGVYATPVPFSRTWTAAPGFTTAYPAAGGLTALGSSIDYCFARMSAVPFAARRLPRWGLGPFKSAAGDPQSEAVHGAYPLHYGGITRNYSQDELRLIGLATSSVPQLRLNLYVNGTLRDQSEIMTPGTMTWHLETPLAAYAVGERLGYAVFGEVVSAGAPASWQSRTRISIDTSRTEGVYPYAVLPAPLSQGAISPEALRDWLNSLSTAVNAVKARIDAAPAIWNRAYAVRNWYSVDGNSRGNLDKRAPARILMQGRRLVVRGKNVSLAFGPLTYPTGDFGKVADEWTHSVSQQLIAGDQVETKEIWLDGIPNLLPGTQYALTGEVQYAAEYLV